MNRLKIFSVILILSLVTTACTSISTSPTPLPAPATQLPLTPSLPATQPASPTPSETQPPTPTPGGAWINLTPDSGPPGTQVQIEGYLPDVAAQPGAQKLESATACWGSCLTSLTEGDLPVKWSDINPGHFQMTFSVPSVPWLGANGPEPLVPGDYIVGVQCLGPELQGCATQEAQAQTTFHLQGPTPTTCLPGQPCASLSFDPPQGAPGTQVQVKGWAPLVGIINGQAFGYDLVMQTPGGNEQPVDQGQVQQSLDGNITGSFTVPQQISNQGVLSSGSYTLALDPIRPGAFQAGSPPPLVAATEFEITGSQTWASFLLGKPLWVQPSADLIEASLTVDPGNRQRLAYCAPGEIHLSQDGGKTWSTISTAAVAASADQGNYPLMGTGSSAPSACLSVTLDSTHPQSFFAVFETMNKTYGAPPVFFTGYLTHDGGEHWQLLPAPSDKLVEAFGGFWTDGQGTVQALYGVPQEVSVEQTADGGVTWSTTALTCPASAACIRWGPAPGSIPGMGSPLPQSIYASTDNGVTWITPGPSVELRMPGPNELVTFSQQEAALLSAGADFPVQITLDGGQTWQVVSLPAFEGTGVSGLQILPDGSLLAQNPDGSNWNLLQPGSNQWCPLNGAQLPQTATLLQLSGDNLWWLSPVDQQPHSLPLSEIKCSG